MPFNVNDLLIKPTYDVAFYGQDKIIPIGTDTLALQSITWSALDELLQPAPTGADAHIEDYSRVLSNVDTLGVANEGDGVRFDRTYEWLSDMSAWVYKFVVNMAVALEITAFTSGAHSIDAVVITVTERRNDASKTEVREVGSFRIATGMTDTTAVESKVVLLHFESNTPFKVAQGNIVRFQIAFESTDTLTATTFEGVMPWYYAQAGNLSKTLIESAISLHLHPALDHAFIALRDQSQQESLDYSGVDINGLTRGLAPV